MKEKDFFARIIDFLMFRAGFREDVDGALQPIITTGSIVWGILLRSFIIIILSFIFMSVYSYHKHWWVSLLLLWLFAAYPGWRQYQSYKKKIQSFEESTLCGKCMHFDPTSQLCKIHDEHVTEDYIPCEGFDWEPKNPENEI